MKNFIILFGKKALNGLLLLVAAAAATAVLWGVAYIVGVGAEKINIAPDSSRGPAYTGMAFIFFAMAAAYVCAGLFGIVKWLINLWKEANE